MKAEDKIGIKLFIRGEDAYTVLRILVANNCKVSICKADDNGEYELTIFYLENCASKHFFEFTGTLEKLDPESFSEMLGGAIENAEKEEVKKDE